MIKKLIFFILLILFFCIQGTFSEVLKAPGFLPDYKDSSVKINFTSPIGMKECLDSKKEHGFYKVFLPEGEDIDNTVIVLIVNSQPKTSRVNNLENFVKFNVDYFISHYPKTKISIIKLPEDVTAKLDNLQVPYYTVLLKSNSDKDISDNIAIFFETPRGLWSICYIAPAKDIVETRDIFFYFIKNMNINKDYE
jgi:hypothetical protein